MDNKTLLIDELARVERLAYFKAWRAANKEKVKSHNQNYWRKRVEKKLLEAKEGNEECADANN